ECSSMSSPLKVRTGEPPYNKDNTQLTSSILEFNITILLDLIGTFAFAISGLRMASGKRIDWFGAFIIALVTAIGGGTTRDLLLAVRPFWMMNPMYFITTAIAFLSAILFKEKLFRWRSTLFM